jgi:uncharacterized protein YqgV (UPF0045/DUF77 family)
MSRTVNLAVQFLPLHLSQAEAYRIIDAAIVVVQASGLDYVVSPFETVIEGPYEEVMEVFNDMQSAAFRAGAGELLINSKLHRSHHRSLRITDKTGKYDS